MKKIFIISGILFGTTLLFWGVYNFAFKKETSITTKQTTPEQTKNAEKFMTTKKEQGKIYVISDEAVIAPIFDKKKEKIIYYSKIDGTTWQMDSDGKNKEQLSAKELKGLESIEWNMDKTKVISTFQNEGKRAFFLYDFVENKATEIKKNADLIAWDNSGAKIIYKYFDEKTKNRSLEIADNNGSNFKTLVDKLPYRKISLKAVPQTSLIAYWNYPDINEESKLQIVSALGGENKILFEKRFGADFLWSPDGEKTLVSSFANNSDKKISLGIVDLTGKYTDLNFPTFAQKCVWSNDKKSIFCAIPGDIPNDAILPNDYNSGKIKTKDTFWKIDVTTGIKERVLELSELKNDYDADNLFLSSTEDALFFVNKIDGKLYRIDL